MREIVLDTETTGLDPDTGDRIVEIGAVELVNHMPTGRTFHAYVNPQRDVPEEAVEVHGLTAAFLADKPVFARGRRRVRRLPRRRAAGDPQRRLRHEVPQRRARLGRAAERSPGRGRSTRSSSRGGGSPARRTRLDALCRRFGVDNSGREKHGALLDSELLAEVYLELMGGRQPDLTPGGRRRRRAGRRRVWVAAAAPAPAGAAADRRRGRGARRLRRRRSAPRPLWAARPDRARQACAGGLPPRPAAARAPRGRAPGSRSARGSAADSRRPGSRRRRSAARRGRSAAGTRSSAADAAAPPARSGSGTARHSRARG